MTIRCKFLCESVMKKRHWDQSKGKFLFTASFHAVSSGSPENEAFFAATPSGRLEVSDFKPDNFVPGQYYFLDLTLAETVPAC